MKRSVAEKTSAQIKQWAAELGFYDCRIAKVDALTAEAVNLESWLKEGLNGTMDYMANYFDVRIDPQKLVPGAKSVIILNYNYFPGDVQQISDIKISKYAHGRDYHKVLRKKLKHFIAKLNEVGELSARGFVDSAPIMEKVWAQKAGLGWQGKNTNIIHPKKGSFFFLSALVLDWELAYDEPIKDYCGTCTKCIDACPTKALSPYKIDGSKCISYLTIELKEAIPTEFKNQMEDWAFGCDVCQDVCPWNRFSQNHAEPDFYDKTGKLALNSIDLLKMSEQKFDDIFLGSPIRRTGYDGIKRNVNFLK
jgi:epoxyqueuosine reductase